MRRFLLLFIAAMVLMSVVKLTAEEKMSDLKFLVVRDYNGKPVRNASVILHPLDNQGRQQGGYQLKTNREGRTRFEGAPYGALRIQVLAQGFQTYGEDFQINQPTTEITIKLKRPGGQYSIYDDKHQTPPEEKKDAPPDDKPDNKDQKQ